MKKFGLTGYPLGHSLSPFIHRELMKISNIEGEYGLFEIAPENLDNDIEKLKTLNGFNVTIPHKINIIPFLDSLDEKAKLFSSVNTVKTGAECKGYNTDCDGFLRALDGAGMSLSGNVLLCGAGGVSRMIAFEAALANCRLTIAARSESIEKAEKLKNEILSKTGKTVSVISYDNISDGYDLIVNGTPVGMFPKVDKCVLKKEAVLKSKAVYDVIYNPAETLLLKYAKEAGIKYSNGLSMLVWQAAVAQEIWNGTEFSNDDIEKVIKLTEEELNK